MNSKDNRLSDANDQSIVMKIEYRGSGVLLTGDTSFRPWKNIIVPFYADTKLRTNILLASHHGSLTFFDDPSDNKYYYTAQHPEDAAGDDSCLHWDQRARPTTSQSH